MIGIEVALNLELLRHGEVPALVEVLPAGPVITGRDGRTWLNDNPAGILAAFMAEGKDLPIDWEHSSERKAPQGEQAPAAGWMKGMQLGPDGIIRATVEWTPRGVESIKNREYRYLSPVFLFDRQTNAIKRITSAGLTNRPNLLLRALNRQEDYGNRPGDGSALNAAQRAINEMLGVSEETWRQYNPVDRKGGIYGNQAGDSSALNATQQKINEMLGVSEETWEKYGPK